jgi:putative membrane protein
MDTKTDQNINKDLILREKLALERTIMTNNTTLLSFVRTSLYFSIAGLSVENLLKVNYGRWFEIGFWIIAIIILAVGIRNYYIQKRKIEESEKHIGDYKLEWEQKK